jgi:hypothetical protein
MEAYNEEKKNYTVLWMIVEISACQPHKLFLCHYITGTRDDAKTYVYNIIKESIDIMVDSEDKYHALVDLDMQLDGDITDIAKIEGFNGKFNGNLQLDDLIFFDRWSSFDNHYYLEKIDISNGPFYIDIFAH